MKSLAVSLMLFSSVVFAHSDATSLTETEQACYAKAMIGFDSVINSRLGVNAEHAIYLTSDEKLRNIIWTAYLWKGTPHTYAVQTYTTCIKS